MRPRLLFGILPALLLGLPASANLVVDLNETTLEAIRFSSTPPPKASRGLAILHLAIYDAVNGIAGRGVPYYTEAKAPAGASAEAAAIAAAYLVQRNLWPQFATVFEASYEGHVATLPINEATSSGLAWGRTVAQGILNHRLLDGSSYVVAYYPRTGPGYWQETPPDFQSALLPQWATLEPFALEAPDQFRPPPPPALTSPEWADDLHTVKALGGADSVERTAEQTEIAWFWADNAGTITPPGHWNRIAQTLALDLDLDLWDSAHLFALLDLALADAAIVSWDAKYTYELWRPRTAIHAADRDGNPDTAPDPAWESLIENPPFPEYVSGHSTFSGAASAILAAWLGTDTYAFASASEGFPGVVRHFEGFSAAAEEAGMSRIYGGIHFPSANREGLAAGRAVATYVFSHYLLRWPDVQLECMLTPAGIELSWPRSLRLESSTDPGLNAWAPVPGATAPLLLDSGGPLTFLRLVANPLGATSGD